MGAPLPQLDDEVLSRMATLLGLPSAHGLAAHTAIQTGLSWTAVDRVAHEGGLTTAEVARLLHWSPATLRRRRRIDEALGPQRSDRLYGMARCLALATAVLGSSEAVSNWLHRGQPGLGEKRPVDLLGTRPGTEAVIDLLVRVADGGMA